ncbi:uncharacterized protein LOC117946003 [Etheostoma cragini]|uniref:uncharacterized protein LOC117946003 n=1 Tax=Etheostoma cragini TaxID=417921 RepID=UPI00155EE3C3|nr:uncharacterized protein LOC117946003 [Etheostoma cragini]
MVNITIKQALKNTLWDLSKDDFLEFCHQLRDRREDPRVRYRDVENKSVLQITNLLVSTFTERGALPVALSLLRQINCNQEAETLYSETKACVDVKGDPTFRKTSSGELDTKPSQEARNHAADRRPLSSPVTEKKPEEVEAEAKARVLSEGGDPLNKRLVLSRFMIQFGQYKGQTFKWLLENDVSYAAKMVVNHEKQRQTTLQSQLSANKDSLKQYAIAYPEVLKEVRFHRGYERSRQSGKKGKALVGFGKHRSETLQDLYESKDRDKISYVSFLRNKKSTCDHGSKMEIAVKYILQRDKKQAAASRKSRASRAPPKDAAK